MHDSDRSEKRGLSPISGKSREIRVGLVMYGGVSLAVYINGVSREFYNGVRGRGVYRLLKALTDSDLVVDVISGTSAGGINGILLGYAICNQREFSACAELWRQHGDIARLVREPAGSGVETFSLLNSETYYQPKLAGAFAGMEPCRSGLVEDVSHTEELDLFVTGTEVAGRRYTVLDDAGHAVDVKDHRTVFQLKHREGRRHPFDPSFNLKHGPPALREAVTHGALAKLGRITSCFPVAFAPVMVEHVSASAAGGDAPVATHIDALLTQWGTLRRTSCFLDGGVLDNKPFTYTVKEIFRRTAERPVERRLFYVEPDPEQFSDIRTVSQPNVAEAALLALIGIPGYESIADDLKLIAHRNSKIRVYRRLAGHLEQASRAQTLAPQSASEVSIYRRTRLVALSKRVVQGLLRVDGDEQLLDAGARREAERLFEEFDTYAEMGGLAAILLQDFDIYYRIRRLFDLIDYCYGSGRRDPRWAEILWVLNRQLKLLDIVRNAMEQLLDEANITWRGASAQAVWQTVGRAFSRLLAVEGKDSPVPDGYGRTRDDNVVRDLLGEANRRLRARIEIIKQEVRHGRLDPPPASASNLLRDADDYERRTITGFAVDPNLWDQDTPLVRYDRFERIDAQLYPLEMFGDVNEKNEIRTVRISPVDAQRGFSRRDSAGKTAGQTLFHFGGFFKRSWRSNDILCGRLDTVAQILEEFFDRQRLQAVAQQGGLRVELQARLGSDLDPATLFPNAGKNAQDALRTWLAALVTGAPEAFEPARFDDGLTLLVEMAQLEILYEDLPKLLVDEVLEQREWQDPDAQRLTPLSAAADAEANAAHQLRGEGTAPAVPPANPRETPVGRFFDQHAGVAGGQSVFTSVPPMVLLDTFARLLLITRDAFLTVFGARAAEVRKSAIYKWIDRALRLFHGGVRFFRWASPQAMALMTGVAAASAVAFLIGLIWWDDIIAPSGEPFRLRWFTLLLLIPAAILAAQAVWLMGRTRLRRLLSVLAVIVAVTLVLAALWRRETILGALASAFEWAANLLRQR